MIASTLFVNWPDDLMSYMEYQVLHFGLFKEIPLHFKFKPIIFSFIWFQFHLLGGIPNVLLWQLTGHKQIYVKKLTPWNILFILSCKIYGE